MADFISANDDAYLAWMTNFHTYAAAHTVEVSLEASDVAEILSQKNEFGTKLAAYRTARDAAAEALQAKEAARASTEEYFRKMARRMTYNEITDAQRAALELPVYDTTRTKAPVPTTRPVLLIGTEKGQEHRVNFADEGTPTRKAKPAGVAAAEIWASAPADAATAVPPTDDGQFHLLGTDTTTPYLARYELADVGKKVWYRARWINSQQQPGPWSPMMPAVITG